MNHNCIKQLETSLKNRVKSESEAHKRRLSAESNLGEIGEALCELIRVVEHLNPCEATLNKAKAALRLHCETCGGCE